MQQWYMYGRWASLLGDMDPPRVTEGGGDALDAVWRNWGWQASGLERMARQGGRSCGSTVHVLPYLRQLLAGKGAALACAHA